MKLQTNLEVLNRITIPEEKRNRIDAILDNLGSSLTYSKRSVVKSVLENSEKLITMKKTMESGMSASDIDVFSNVLSVVVPKFWINTIVDKVVNVQKAETPYPVIYFVDQEYADAFTETGALGASDTTLVAGDLLREKRTHTYGMVGESSVARGIKASVRSKSVTTQIRRINAEWTLESIIALASVMGLENANSFVDERLTNTIYSKLKDEAEFDVINELWNYVPAVNTANFELNPTDFSNDPVKLEYYKKTFGDVIEQLAAQIFRQYGVKPNVLVVGPDAYSLLDREKLQIVPGGTPFSGTLGRIFLGVYNMAYEIVYDPFMPGVLMTCNYPEHEVFSGVFAPYLVGTTPPITEKNANTYRIIYRCDAFEVVTPNTLGKVVFV